MNAGFGSWLFRMSLGASALGEWQTAGGANGSGDRGRDVIVTGQTQDDDFGLV
jgi:hypothetical protein